MFNAGFLRCFGGGASTVLTLSFLVFASASLFGAEGAPPAKGRLKVTVLDSATGASVVPDRFSVRMHGPDGREHALGAGAFSPSGQSELQLEVGRHALTAVAPGYNPVSGAFQMEPNSAYEVRFLLDPLEEPEQVRPKTIDALRLSGFMIIQGFIVDDQASQKLQGVSVTELRSGQVVVSDADGFFRMHVAAPEEMEPTGALLIEKPGYKRQSLHNIEIWSQGDCTYRLRMQRGGGEEIIDESALRRRAPSLSSAEPSSTDVKLLSAEPMRELVEPPHLATLPQNATVRVPRNIRVRQTNNTTIDYVSLTYYSRAVLGSEWIASWGSIAGGTNSLNAGAVAVRCYAISRINNASATSTYDICGTSSCQVYNPFKIHSLSDTAVYYTADWVLLNGTAISGTEYSAENNAFGTTTFGCPDGFTEPNSSCLYDPICAGQTRFGHGRGMCQWGTARWATGRKMNNRVSSDTTPSGFPLRDWKWIVQHYYPTLAFVKGASLVVGDDIKALKTLDVHACPGGEITNGTACALVTTKATGATGVILAGPVTVTSDAKGFTWYKIQWNDASLTIGWSVENYIERVFANPSAPTSLMATALSTNQIRLTWTDTTDVEAGFEIERAPAAGGPWIEIASLPAGSNSYVDGGLLPGNTWHYRVRTYNAGGASGYSGTANATTVLPGPVIGAISPATIPEQQLFQRAVSASVSELAKGFGDVNPFPSETANGTVLFRTPTFSGSTSAMLEANPNIAAVTDAFPTTGYATGKVLRARFAFNSTANPWLRLTTSSATYYANPVIDLAGILRFRVYADKSISLAVGCRETTTSAGTAIGSNGGTSGGIEWVGVTNTIGTAPAPTRVIPAGTWTTVSFDLPNEPALNFSGGNGVLSTASGLGVLEHLAIVPRAGIGEYNVYLDDFQVVQPRAISWSLGAGAPSGLAISPTTGDLSWTPTEAQGPGVYPIQVIATASGTPATSATNSFTLTVAEVNLPPVLDPVADRIVHAGTLVTFTNSATDPDLPANTITFSLAGNPPGSEVSAATGVFTWPTTDQHANTTNAMEILAADNGMPQGTDSQSFTIIVLPQPRLGVSAIAAGDVELSWEAIPGTSYLVQYKNDLLDPAWQPLTNVTAAVSAMTITNDLSGPRKFFRVVTGTE